LPEGVFITASCDLFKSREVFSVRNNKVFDTLTDTPFIGAGFQLSCASLNPEKLCSTIWEESFMLLTSNVISPVILHPFKFFYFIAVIMNSESGILKCPLPKCFWNASVNPA
jgi:hypothetical protein